MAPLAEYPITSSAATPYPGALSPAISSVSGDGAIAGSKLRPGAIDQSQFQEMLLAQARRQQMNTSAGSTRGMTLADYRKLAGNSPRSAPAAVQPNPVAANDGIPTLSLAQFAALTGMELPPESDPLIGDADAPTQTAEAVSPTEAADGIPVSPSETAESTEIAPRNSRMVMLDSYPDREEQKSLAAQGKIWRLKETPGARELFLGPDGKFGWDDFVDIINPLQHIPIVAQIYRAVTGDQAYALSNFIGALPFGPLSVASAIADTMVRAQTGRDAGTDMAARVLGIDNRTAEEADLHLVTGDASQTASVAAGSGEASLQVAAVPSAGGGATASSASRSGSAWTRDSAGVSRD